MSRLGPRRPVRLGQQDVSKRHQSLVRSICNDTNSGICQPKLADGSPCGGDKGDDEICASGYCRGGAFNTEICCPTDGYRVDSTGQDIWISQPWVEVTCRHLPEGSPCHGHNHLDQCGWKKNIWGLGEKLFCDDVTRGACRPLLGDGEICGGDMGDDKIYKSGKCRAWKYQERCCPDVNQAAQTDAFVQVAAVLGPARPRHLNQCGWASNPWRNLLTTGSTTSYEMWCAPTAATATTATAASNSTRVKSAAATTATTSVLGWPAVDGGGMRAVLPHRRRAEQPGQVPKLEAVFSVLR